MHAYLIVFKCIKFIALIMTITGLIYLRFDAI